MPDGAEANRYRIDRLERDVEHLVGRLEDYAALKQNVVSLSHEVAKLDAESKALRRALYTAALSVGGSAVLFGVSVVVAIVQ